MVDFTGLQIDKYILKKRLGQGGEAKVYLGEHVDTRKEVAIKIFEADSVDSVERAKKEFTILSVLNGHRYIIRAYECRSWQRQNTTYVYIVMEYFPRGSLYDRYPLSSRLPLHQIVTYVEQIAEALQFAHDKGIVHRDVKPQNILLENDQTVCLADFGIVGIIGVPPGDLTKMVAGTPNRRAPEQWSGDKQPSIDQYALAMVAYEYLCGTPYTAKSLSLRQIRPELSPAVEAVVMRALSENPKERFSTVREFAQSLKKAATLTLTSPFETVEDSFELREDPQQTRQVVSLIPTYQMPAMPPTFAANNAQKLPTVVTQGSPVRRSRVSRWSIAGLVFVVILLSAASFFVGETEGKELSGSLVPSPTTALARSFQTTPTAIPPAIPLTDFASDLKASKLGNLQINPLADYQSDGQNWSNSKGRSGVCTFPGHGYFVLSETNAGYTCASQSSYSEDLALRVHVNLISGDVVGITIRLTKIPGVSSDSLLSYYSFRVAFVGGQGTVKFFKIINKNSTTLGGVSDANCSNTSFSLGTDPNDSSPDYTLGIIAVGSHITMYVNDERVYCVSDTNNPITSGGLIGLAAGPGPGDAPNSNVIPTPAYQAFFHELQYWS